MRGANVRPPSSIRVEDSKPTASRAGEAGIAGAVVPLLDSSKRLSAPRKRLRAAPFTSPGLTPGVYHVGFTGPSGYTFTTQDVGANGFDAIDSDANT